MALNRIEPMRCDVDLREKHETQSWGAECCNTRFKRRELGSVGAVPGKAVVPVSPVRCGPDLVYSLEQSQSNLSKNHTSQTEYKGTFVKGAIASNAVLPATLQVTLFPQPRTPGRVRSTFIDFLEGGTPQ